MARRSGSGVFGPTQCHGQARSRSPLLPRLTSRAPSQSTRASPNSDLAVASVVSGYGRLRAPPGGIKDTPSPGAKERGVDPSYSRVWRLTPGKPDAVASPTALHFSSSRLYSRVRWVRSRPFYGVRALCNVPCEPRQARKGATVSSQPVCRRPLEPHHFLL